MGREKTFPVVCEECGVTAYVPHRWLQQRQRFCSRTCSGIARSQAAALARDEGQATKPMRPCRHCAVPFHPKEKRASFCSRQCSSRWQAAQLAATAASRPSRADRARTRIEAATAYVDAINAEAFCTQCGAQPVEWHNPEHVELNRQGYRIGRMRSTGASIQKIEAELARCTPLCRRCHMAEDGRLTRFVAAGGGRHPRREDAP